MTSLQEFSVSVFICVLVAILFGAGGFYRGEKHGRIQAHLAALDEADACIRRVDAVLGQVESCIGIAKRCVSKLDELIVRDGGVTYGDGESGFQNNGWAGEAIKKGITNLDRPTVFRLSQQAAEGVEPVFHIGRVRTCPDCSKALDLRSLVTQGEVDHARQEYFECCPRKRLVRDPDGGWHDEWGGHWEIK